MRQLELDLDPNTCLRANVNEQISTAVDKVLLQFHAEADKYLSHGERWYLGFLLGHAMMELQGKANPMDVRNCLGNRLARMRTFLIPGRR